MKLKKLALTASMSLLAIGMTGCLGDSDSSAPELTISGDMASSVKAGESIPVLGEVESEAGIKAIELVFDNANLTSEQLALVSKGTSSDDDAILSTSIEAAEDACNGEYSVEITAVDEDDKKAIVSVSFSVTDGVDCGEAVVLAEKTDGMIYNVSGLEKGAFDLVTGALVGASEEGTTKDLLDISVGGEGFAKTLSSGNGAMFVAADPDFSYADATDKSVMDAFEAGSAVETTAVLAVDDVVIVKLGADREVAYAVLKITKVDVDAGEGNNTGVIEFSYKK